MAQPGHYYQKQIGCRSSVISWSHRARFDMARRLIGDRPVGRMLDYGCGDGTFLASAASLANEAWGADIADDQLQDCAARLGDIPNLRFCHVDQLCGPEHEAQYDVVMCMETLEHCTAPVVERVLRDLARLVAPTGRVIISVPIETGFSFLLKYVFRTIAGWRGLSDYKYYERYSLRHAVRMLMAGASTTIPRPVYGPPEGEFHSHYGFNWRHLRECVRGVLRLDRTCFSPLGWLGGLVNSQAWFECRPQTKMLSTPRGQLGVTQCQIL